MLQSTSKRKQNVWKNWKHEVVFAEGPPASGREGVEKMWKTIENFHAMNRAGGECPHHFMS